MRNPEPHIHIFLSSLTLRMCNIKQLQLKASDNNIRMQTFKPILQEMVFRTFNLEPLSTKTSKLPDNQSNNRQL